jgi:hypothetical protein
MSNNDIGKMTPLFFYFFSLHKIENERKGERERE